ncbi:major facilitator superfamily domain-containing protein [Coniochaeta sp. 2T2.1]|nr:major facilitator superfamily domain-containing protein [Coniochaeta sp. 2T2.1]
MVRSSTLTGRLYRESGLRSVYTTGLDAWLLIISRCCRMFAYGSSSLVLALFFAELNVSDEHIGLFMTLTLAGDVVLSLLLTLVADRVGRRRTLLAGSVLMMLSGAAFALCEGYWVLLVAAVIGVISATGGDFGPFRAIEESTLSELTTPKTRADVLVWYVTMSSLGSSVGTACSGWAIEWLHDNRSWTLLEAYHATFWLYVATGTVNLLASLLLSGKCELKKDVYVPCDGTVEAEPFLDQSNSGDEGAHGKASLPAARTAWVAQISSQTCKIMLALWFLLMVDSLADGMVSMSLTTYYMDQKFHLAKSSLGSMLSVGYLLASCSTIFAGPLSRHMGLVNTMVFTHIPSSAAVLLFPFPQSVGLTFALLLLRVGLNNMDQAPRAALIAAVVRPEERTAVMGITGMLRTLASTVGPTVTGVLSGSDRFWIAFVVAGALRLAYDIGLFAMFINIELYKHEPDSNEATQSISLRETSRLSEDQS